MWVLPTDSTLCGMKTRVKVKNHNPAHETNQAESWERRPRARLLKAQQHLPTHLGSNQHGAAAQGVQGPPTGTDRDGGQGPRHLTPHCLHHVGPDINQIPGTGCMKTSKRGSTGTSEEHAEY